MRAQHSARASGRTPPRALGDEGTRRWDAMRPHTSIALPLRLTHVRRQLEEAFLHAAFFDADFSNYTRETRARSEARGLRGLKPSPVRSQSLRLKRGPSRVEPTVGSSVSRLGFTKVRMMTPDAQVLRDDCSSYPRRMTISPELAPNLQEVFGGSPRSSRTHSERFQEDLHGSRR